MRNNSKALLVVLVAILVVTAACSQAQPSPVPVRPTRTPRPTFTPTVEAPPTEPLPMPTATVEVVVPPTEAAPTATVAPTDVPATETPQAAAATLSARQNVNVRRGPGTNYPIVGRLSAGQTAEITGKNDAGNWIQFNFEGEPGWVSRELIDVTGDEAVVQVAQNIPAPPTAAPTTPPQPRPTSPPAAPTAPPPPPQPSLPFKLTATGTCAANPGSSYVDGFVRHRDNSLYNGVCVHIAFYGPRNTKCSGCDGVGDGNWSFSPFGGPAPAGTTVEVFVVQCPGPLPHGGQTQETGFGNLTPVSDKWVHTFSQSEECHGITFVGD